MTAGGASVLHSDRATAIVRLFFSCGPTAIARFVIPIVVNAIDSVKTCWLEAHVAKEGRKVILPAITNRKATPAIVFVIVVLGIVASALEGAPGLVLWGVRVSTAPSSRMAMLELRPVAEGASKTTARFRNACHQRGSDDVFSSSALASASPLRARACLPAMGAVPRQRLLNNCEASEYAPDQVKSVHGS